MMMLAMTWQLLDRPGGAPQTVAIDSTKEDLVAFASPHTVPVDDATPTF